MYIARQTQLHARNFAPGILRASDKIPAGGLFFVADADRVVCPLLRRVVCVVCVSFWRCRVVEGSWRAGEARGEGGASNAEGETEPVVDYEFLDLVYEM